MKRILLLVWLVASAIGVYAQNINVRKLTVRDSIWLNGKWVKKVNSDTATFNSAGDNEVPSTKAIKSYVDNLVSAGGGVVTNKNFASVAALKASNFNATPGDLKANILDGGASYKWNPTSTATDDGGVTTIQVTGVATGRWEKIFNGTLRADEGGIKTDGTDQSAALNTIALNAGVKDILIDNGNITVLGSVNFQNKTVIIKNGSQLIGTGTVSNFYLEANHKQVFGTSLNISGLLNDKEYFEWFGGVADYATTKTDNYPIMLKALAASTIPIILFAKQTSLTAGYWFSQTNTLKKDCQLIGEGSINGVPTTRLIVAANDTVIYTRYTDAANAVTVNLSNLTLEQEAPVGAKNLNAHGVVISTLTYGDNLRFQNISGDGLHADASSPTSSVNGSVFDNCWATNCTNGYYTIGSDANIMHFNNCTANSNRHWGIYSSGFLGDIWNQPHLEANGNDTDVLVTYNAVNYKAINQIGGSNINRRPDTATGYWKITTACSGFAMWDSTKNYYSGGTFWFVNENAKNYIINPYTEICQPEGMAASRTRIENGLISTTFVGGVWTYALFGKLYTNASIYVGGDTTASGSDITSFTVHSGNYYSAYKKGYFLYDGVNATGTGMDGNGAGILNLRTNNLDQLSIGTNGLPYLRVDPPAGDSSMYMPTTGWVKRNITSSSGGMTNPMTTFGDIIYGGASGAPTRLAGNITTGKQFLTQAGTGTASVAPIWSGLVAADIPDLSATYIKNQTTQQANANYNISGIGAAGDHFDAVNGYYIGGAQRLVDNGTANTRLKPQAGILQLFDGVNQMSTQVYNALGDHEVELKQNGNTSEINATTSLNINTNGVTGLSIASNQVVALSTLKTGLTPPTTSGLLKTVITDANGAFSFINLAIDSLKRIAGTDSVMGRINGSWIFQYHDSVTNATNTSLVIVNDVDYTIAAGITDVVVKHQTAARTITLPAAASNTNRRITITNGGDGAFVLNLSTPIRENVSTTTSSVAQSFWVTIVSDGTEWWLVASK